MKQETLKERVKRLSECHDLQTTLIAFANVGAEWQQERMYTEEDLREAFKQSRRALIFKKEMPPVYENFEEWFEQSKKK